MPKVDPIIRTKLHRPYIRPGLVSRPRLLEQIRLGLDGPLTLITAPAGFGKTTLIASCIDQVGKTAAWLSLDRSDNRPELFLRNLIAALQEANQTIGREALQLLVEGDQVHAETVLTNLINDLDHANLEFILVFDDYQFIINQAVHQLVTIFLEHCPSTFHFVIATRSDPPLPLTRLRARGYLVELRAADLRFTSSEAAQFLNEVMGLNLDARSILTLGERTEGWIAGLQMAALSVRYRKDIPDFIESFSGTNRHIMDYLLEEVLSGQPAEVQFFLLCTSILERLTAPLCQAILAVTQERVDGGSTLTPEVQLANPLKCQAILDHLDRANLFLVSLDEERKWYRYHHLFADLLRSRLDEFYPGLALRLHALASAWYETTGLYEEAIYHAFAAREYSNAARLVETVAETAWLTGRYSSILTWTKVIPSEFIHQRPWLCVWNGWANTQQGVSVQIDQWIEAAQQAIKQQYGDVSENPAQDTLPEIQTLLYEIAALKVFSISFTKDYQRAIELAEKILRNPPVLNRKVDQFTRCNLMHLLSSMYYATGDLLKAEQTCQETIHQAKAIGFTLRLVHATNKRMLIHRVFGRLHSSFQELEETLAWLQAQGFGNFFAARQLQFRLIDLLYEWNRLEELKNLFETLVHWIKLVDSPYLLVDFYNLQALWFLIQQDYMESQEALNKARALAQQSYIWEGLSWVTERLQVRLWLERGETSLAAAWAAHQPNSPVAALHFSTESRAIAQVRILLAQGACLDAVQLLDRLIHTAEGENRTGSLIELRALKAIAFYHLQELRQAVAEVEHALALAESEGYIRAFLDEGQPMARLLTQVTTADASPHAQYALRLLSMFPEEIRIAGLPVKQGSERSVTALALSNASLIEPLSQRELEILQLMALGRTNQEIARQLIVATGTVKAHAASIYRKLDVGNRTEAVAQARKLGLLP